MIPALRSRGPWRAPLIALAGVLAGPTLASGQAGAGGVGSVRGTVTQSDDGSPLSGVLVSVKGTTIATATNVRGRYTIERVPAGAQTLVFRWLGYRPTEVAVTVSSGGEATADAKLE